MKWKTIGFWTATVLVGLSMLSGGIAELLRLPDNVKGVMQLGYPEYFVSIIGFWKVLGAITLFAPRFPRLKEWAYAGIFFNMTGAAVSHIVCGSETWHVVVTLTIAALALASWGLRPATRKL